VPGQSLLYPDRSHCCSATKPLPPPGRWRRATNSQPYSGVTNGAGIALSQASPRKTSCARYRGRPSKRAVCTPAQPSWRCSESAGRGWFSQGDWMNGSPAAPYRHGCSGRLGSSPEEHTLAGATPVGSCGDALFISWNQCHQAGWKYRLCLASTRAVQEASARRTSCLDPIIAGISSRDRIQPPVATGFGSR